MAASSVPENPYAAPTADSSPVSLAEDTEFLFNDKVIAGIGKISLPNLCVFTGERDKLIRRQTNLHCCSRWLTIPRNTLIIAAVISFAQLVSIGSRPVGIGGSFFYRLPIFVGTGATIGVLCFSVVGRLLGQTITVEWSIAARMVQRIRWIWILGASASVIAFTLTAVLALADSDYWPLSLFFAMTISLTTFSYARAAGYRTLSSVGRHNGLFLIGGFREPFLKRVQELAEQRSSRESGASPMPD